MASDLREELNCSICLNIYTDPVTLSCGHNFCQVCIENVWDNQDKGNFSCPECRHSFKRKPRLQRNLRLCNVVEHFLRFQPKEEETGIFCTYCIHSSVPASKFCLMCEASLCDTHLRVHSKSEEHVLTEPTTSWGNRKCPLHKKVLGYYCCEDAACICVSCTLAGEHRGHQVELLNEASDKKKEILRYVLENLTSKRENTEKRVQTQQAHMSDVIGKASGLKDHIIVLFKDIREQLDVLEKRLLIEITRQEELILFPISDLIEELEREKDELSRKMRHIEELCNMDDPLTVLQEQESHNADFCDTEKIETQRFYNKLPTGDDLDEDLISEILYRGLDDIVTDVKVKRGFNVQEVSDILLDINTAANDIIISGDFKTASWTEINQKRPETPERFQCFQVLSTRSFSSGRHYWEVETSETGGCRVGMCYLSIERRGRQSMIGYNSKSWCFGSFKEDISILYDSEQTPLLVKPFCKRLGILLDYEAGRLSFYELCDPIRHLHTFTATFTEPLHAAFCAWSGGWVRVRS